MRFLLAILLTLTLATAFAEPLPSWNEGPAKQALTTFVADVTNAGGPDFVPPAQRVAVFDNDGTLWVEQPIYTQFAFALDQLEEMASEHPEWRAQQPFKAALEGDLATLTRSDREALSEILIVTHSGMTDSAFRSDVSNWIATARHPRFDRLYTELAYQPMLELLDFLQINGFKTFIVSGGGIAFMRPWTERVYGIPAERVVGTQIEQRFELRDGVPVLMREGDFAFIDDKAGKPVGISNHIGRRPILAFGNSDGDLQMLQWTTAAPGRRLGLILHHDDAQREYAYDRASHVGHLDKAMDLAEQNGWYLVSMKKDWREVFAPSDD